MEALIERINETDPQWQEFMVREIERLLQEHEQWVCLGKPPVNRWTDIQRYLMALEGGDSLHAIHLDDKLAELGFDVWQLLERASRGS